MSKAHVCLRLGAAVFKHDERVSLAVIVALPSIEHFSLFHLLAFEINTIKFFLLTAERLDFIFYSSLSECIDVYFTDLPANCF